MSADRIWKYLLARLQEHDRTNLGLVLDPHNDEPLFMAALVAGELVVFDPTDTQTVEVENVDGWGQLENHGQLTAGTYWLVRKEDT